MKSPNSEKVWRKTNKWSLFVLMINGGSKAYLGLENNCKSTNLVMWDKKKLFFETLVIPSILYGCEVWGCNISREFWRKIEQI